jgi:methylenetetrahydrofolate reductase (NADPH)
VSDRAPGPGGRLADILRRGGFAVTGEVVPPPSADGSIVTEHARGLVGYVDAANVTDNPAASAHMSPAAGAAFVARAGLEPTLQITCRDRNRLAITSELLGAWAVGARNLLCLSGDPVHVGDDPGAKVVNDLNVVEVVKLARRLRDQDANPDETQRAGQPRYLIGVADLPLADPYEPARLEVKVDAGADLVFTQITFDVEALEAWFDVVRTRGILDRAKVLIGIVPLRSAKGARYMQDHLPGVSVPPDVLRALDDAGEDAAAVGLELTIDIVRRIAAIDGIGGVHLMGMGHDDAVRAVVEGAGLFPRPTGL